MTVNAHVLSDHGFGEETRRQAALISTTFNADDDDTLCYGDLCVGMSEGFGRSLYVPLWW